MDRKEYMRKYNCEHKERKRELTNKWREEHRGEYLKSNLKSVEKRQKRIRQEIFILLGNKCTNPNCPIPSEKLDPRGLQIDHVNGGGTKMRKKLGISNCYFRILKEIKAGSLDYQLLCAYCNFIKRLDTKRERGGVNG